MHVRSLAAAMLVAAGFASLSAIAAPCGGFTDVDDTNPLTAPFCENVEWVKNRGITLGCTSPTLYCPFDNVSRLQMAAFLNRLGNVTFQQGGNAFGVAAFLGTTDNRSLRIKVNDQAAMWFEPKAISPNLIGGHVTNGATFPAHGAHIGGGGAFAFTDPDFPDEGPNVVHDHYGTIGGGFGNRAGDVGPSALDSAAATVAGGVRNTASGSRSFVGGGMANEASGRDGSVVGGNTNRAEGDVSTVGGGSGNAAVGSGSTISGGDGNVALDDYSSVGGGFRNNALGRWSTVVGGNSNSASGFHASVLGGVLNTASGHNSIAMGNRAKAAHDGTFVFADSTNFDFSTNVSNNFRVRATGGVRFVVAINPSTGVTTWTCGLVDGDPGWVCTSDVNQKQDLALLDGEAVLDELAAMPVYAWSPKGPKSHVRHYGPTAQDFHAAFGLGDTDLGIGQQDADGVALAAIQGLNTRLAEQTAAAKRQLSMLDQQRREIEDLQERLARAESLQAELAELRSVVAELQRTRSAIARH